MPDFSLKVPDAIRRFLAETIVSARGHEVYFLARVHWPEEGATAEIEEVDVFARGNRGATPAIIEGAQEWDLAIHNHPGGDLRPSEADVGVAAELGNRQVGFAITDNRAERWYVLVPPFRRETTLRVEEDEIEAAFARGGALDRTLCAREGPGRYEHRPGQVAMAREVARAINSHGVVALEAGTGVGKSFAYLVPAVLWAARNKKRVIVSTNTIHLQEQLVTRDLPFLAEALDQEFRFALIKGRSNYACLRKAAETRAETGALFDSADRETVLRDLLGWVENSDDGSLGDLGMTPDPDVWEQIMSESDKSLKVNCSFYQRCFYYRAKRRAFQSDVLVVNHHLFFSDLGLRRESGNYQWDLILPAYDRVIFDEAHHLEDVASQHLGVRFTQEGIARRFSRLVSSRDARKGVLPNLARKLRLEGAPVPADTIENHYIPLIPRIAEKVEHHFQGITRIVESSLAVRSPGPPTPPTLQLRLTAEPAQATLRRAIADRLTDVRRDLELLGRMNDRALRTLKAASIDEKRKASLLLELAALSGRLDRLLEGMAFFSDTSDTAHVRWLEIRTRGRRRTPTVHCASSPIRVAEVLRSAVYEPMKTVVMASATLAVGGKADFFGSRVGLDELSPERFRFREYASPFDYSRQVLALVPVDFPDPRDSRYQGRLVDTIREVVRRLRGRTFVLFTSYALLTAVYEALERDLIGLGVRPLRQGAAGRTDLLRRFRSGLNNVLFGTDSFWEGVDVRGRALECVIITRLPFRVPTEPLQLARVEDLENRGLAPFPHFTVPQAVLKFKQGFGRLIRSDQDRGVVLVLDRRIIEKNYGRVFLDSLPPVRLVTGRTPDLLGELEAFFGDAGSSAPDRGQESPRSS